MMKQLNLFEDNHPLQPIEILNKECERHSVDVLFAMFSGGHDSLVSTHIASQHPLFKGVLHIDTGIGIPDTQEYVIDVCKQFGWELFIYRAVENTYRDGSPNPQIYEDLVLDQGFPGPAHHAKMYQRLKKLQVGRFVRDRKDFKRIGFATGIRNSESPRRRRNYKEDSERDGRRVWIPHIRHLSAENCDAYMKTHNLPRNPVKDALCMSGECLCGAFAQPNELIQIEIHYPEVGRRLRELEKKVKAKGFNWGWDEKIPTSYLEKRKREKLEDSGQLTLCSSCNFHYENNIKS